MDGARQTLVNRLTDIHELWLLISETLWSSNQHSV